MSSRSVGGTQRRWSSSDKESFDGEGDTPRAGGRPPTPNLPVFTIRPMTPITNPKPKPSRMEAEMESAMGLKDLITEDSLVGSHARVWPFTCAVPAGASKSNHFDAYSLKCFIQALAVSGVPRVYARFQTSFTTLCPAVCPLPRPSRQLSTSRLLFSFFRKH